MLSHGGGTKTAPRVEENRSSQYQVFLKRSLTVFKKVKVRNYVLRMQIRTQDGRNGQK
jgi:hypothetical protein